ncbi:hypothetical protein SAMN03159341_103132 [Paenibacillus sp. 1_12]|nr:hypothetical protein SAMN03159341_103132 [Paenibacillus sp. 1_12]
MKLIIKIISSVSNLRFTKYLLEFYKKEVESYRNALYNNDMIKGKPV